MARLACALAAALALALPGAALAATPGQYTGMTEQNYPIEFDVAADGASLTNVVTTANATCNGGPAGPGKLVQLSTDSQYPFAITGDAFDGADPDEPPYLKFRGGFAGARASGTLDAFSGGSYNGGYYQCNALQVPWTARLAGGGGDDGGGGGDDGGGGAGGGQPTVTIAFPKGVKLKPSLANGFIVGFSSDPGLTLAAKLILGAKDAKKYGLGKKALTVSKSSAAGGPDAGFEFKFKKAVRNKLKKAKSLKFLLEVTAPGAGVIASQTLKLS